MDEGLREEILRDFPEVDAVLPARLHLLDFRNRLVMMVGLDTAAFLRAQGHSGGDDKSLSRNLARYPQLPRRTPQPVLVSENFAALYG